jgi:hypothetical protein
MARATINEYIQPLGLTREDIYPTGRHEAWANDMQGFVVDTATGAIVKRFKGETAWSDAARYAGDVN